MGSYGRLRRRGNPVVAVVVFAAFAVVLGLVFAALSLQQIDREHDKAWSYEQVAFVNCHYDHTHKSTSYYNCEVGDPSTGALLYGGTTSVSTSSGSRPPSDGSRWLHRVNGTVDEVGTAFPLWVCLLEVLPVAGLVFAILGLRKARRRKRAMYGGQPPTGFGAPTGFGQATVTDQPGYPGAQSAS